MVDNTLKAEPLPAELIIADFVENELDCNCEKYMLQFINKSPYFLSKSKGQLYTAPVSEFNGECDYNSDNYALDLKLIASQTLMEAKSILSDGKVLLAPGAWMTTASKVEGKRTVTRLHAALREYNLEQLIQLRQKNKGLDKAEKDVRQFLSKLETKKNLLLFFPYEFKFDKDYDILQGIAQIQDALNHDFHYALEFRNSVHCELDTFFAFIYQDCMVFLVAKNNLLEYIDHIKLNESPIYKKLESYSNWL